jgi:arylsulfatase A-like enzyme
LLKNNGYRTGAFGKWHVGLDWVPMEDDPGDFHWGTQVRAKGVVGMISQRVDHSKPVTLGPTHLGFDTCFITPSNNTRIPVWVRDNRVVGSPKPDKTGLMRDPDVERDKVDDVFVQEAINFLEDCRKNHAEKPFFIYLPLNAIHGATLPPERFKGKSGIGSTGDKCMWLDENVGKILKALDKLDASDNTLVIFTSDNGPVTPKNSMPGSAHSPAGPYRGYKTDAWDGGCRVPFLVRWPKRIKAGRTHDSLLCLTDMLATFASLLGESLPQWAGEDSINQLPTLLGKTEKSARENLITQSYTGVLSVRQGPWKLIIDTEGSGGHTVTPGTQSVVSGSPWEFAENKVGQLYQINNDPYETTDLYDKHPELVANMKEYLKNAVSSGRTR